MLVLSSEEAGHETSTGIYRVIVAFGEAKMRGFRSFDGILFRSLP